MCSSSVLPSGVEYTSQGQNYIIQTNQLNVRYTHSLEEYATVNSFLNDSWSDFGFIKTWHNIGRHKKQLFVTHSKLFFHNRNYFHNQIKLFLLLARSCVCLGCVTLHTPSLLACSASPSRNGMAKELKSCGEQTNTMIELIKNHFHNCGTSHLLHKNTIMNNSQIYCGILLNGSKVKLYSTPKSQGIIQITDTEERV